MKLNSHKNTEILEGSHYPKSPILDPASVQRLLGQAIEVLWEAKYLAAAERLDADRLFRIIYHFSLRDLNRAYNLRDGKQGRVPKPGYDIPGNLPERAFRGLKKELPYLETKKPQ